MWRLEFGTRAGLGSTFVVGTSSGGVQVQVELTYCAAWVQVRLHAQVCTWASCARLGLGLMCRLGLGDHVQACAWGLCSGLLGAPAQAWTLEFFAGAGGACAGLGLGVVSQGGAWGRFAEQTSFTSPNV